LSQGQEIAPVHEDVPVKVLTIADVMWMGCTFPIFP